jgi:hypothetical protein
MSTRRTGNCPRRASAVGRLCLLVRCRGGWRDCGTAGGVDGRLDICGDYFRDRYRRVFEFSRSGLAADIEASRALATIDPAEAAVRIIALSDGLQLQCLHRPSRGRWPSWKSHRSVAGCGGITRETHGQRTDG